ncbi:MAG: hypothetical protein IPM29_08020 [Planctomycetes bacterium]|nr:hypothetical protein [Planctomycetota bacterium]
MDTEPAVPRAMSSRERMAVAMACGRADRVPVMCQLSLGHVFLHSGGDPVEIWHDGEVLADALCTMQRRYGFDGILVNLPGRDPDWRARVARFESADSGWRVHWRGGRVTDQPRDDNPHVTAADGKPLTVPLERVDPESLFYVEPHDLEGLRTIPPDGFPPWQCDTLRAVRARAGEHVSVHAEVFSPFTQLLELVGYQDALLALIVDPGRALACLARLAEGAVHLGRRYADAGCDALLVSSAFVGAGFISRAHYERFELPFVRRVVTGVKELHPALPIYVHTCGAIGDRLDLLEATGVDGIDTFDPPPLGTIELADALAALGGRVFVKGNLDPVHTLLRGDVAAVRTAVRERLELAGRRGGYVLSSACSVPPRTPPANLLVLREEVERFDA